MQRAAGVAFAVGLLGLALGNAGTLAQESYPVAGRTLRLITPHGAGSGADILSRLVGPKLAERWKLTAVTDNRTGASGDIDSDRAPRPIRSVYAMWVPALPPTPDQVGGRPG